MAEREIIVRFPPSPTGLFHIGSARTALFNFLFARKNQGRFILRIEDTDRERSQKEFEDNIFDSLHWLGLQYDNNEIIHQSSRLEVYKKNLEQLIKEGKAYISKETEGENKEVIRFKNPNTDITFNDLVRGEITFNTEELGDFIIARNINDPLYHLAVVVDDLESGVTHVIRGEDGISNTPRQILILEALGGNRPTYAHLPLVLAQDRSKLSKRKHGKIVSLNYYRQQGYLPEAVINYMALLGWNPGTKQEIFTLSELIEQFSLEKIQKGGAIFDEEKLRWVNKEHLNRLSLKDFGQEIKTRLLALKFMPTKPSNQVFGERLISVIREKIETFSDLETLITEGELDYYFTRPDYEVTGLIWQGQNDKRDFTQAHKHLNFIKNILETMPEKNFKAEVIRKELWGYANEKGRGEVLWPLRFCLSGKEKSTDPFTLIEILGKTETIERLSIGLEKLVKIK